jgi:hypothetical protein
MPEKILNDLLFKDGIRQFDLKLNGDIGSLDELSQTPSNLIIGSGGGRFKRNDPTFSEFEQETWEDGALAEFYFEDPTRYRESGGLESRFPKKLLLQNLWRISTGLGRVREQYMPGSVTWISLTGDNRAVALQPTGGVTLDMVNLLIRRRGSPGTLTLEIRADSSSLPNGAVAKTVTKTTSDVTDTLDEFLTFDWTTTQAFSSHWIVLYGASGDNEASHWEIGVDASAAGGYSIDNPADTDWQTADFKPYYLLSDADTDVRWHPMQIGTNMYIVSQPPSGNSVIKLWNESTKVFDTVSPTGDAISGIVKDVCVSNSLGWFAMGTGGSDTAIMQFDHNAGTPRTNLDATATNKADLIMAGNFPTVAAQIFTARNAAAAGDTYCIKRQPVTAYNTDLAPEDTWSFEKGLDILGMELHDSKVYARTRNGLVSVAYNATFANELIMNENTGLSRVLETATYLPMISDGGFLYYPFSFSTQMMSGLVHKDIGLWRGTGLPQGRQGQDSCFCQGFGGIYKGVDAGSTGTSSVWFWNGRGWHEVWRAWKAGIRVRNVWYQSQNGTAPARLWINCGNDLIYIEQPDNGLLPFRDTDTRYVWGGYIVSTIHDFNAFQSPKFFEGLDLIAKNLGQNVSIEVDIQAGKDVGTTTWYPINTKAFTSPVSRVKLSVADENEMAYRLRFETSDSSLSPILSAAVMVGVARSISKRQWNLSIIIGHSKDENPMEVYDWLMDASRAAKPVKMYSKLLEADDVSVLVRAPRKRAVNYNKSKKKETAIVSFSLLEVDVRENVQY